MLRIGLEYSVLVEARLKVHARRTTSESRDHSASSIGDRSLRRRLLGDIPTREDQYGWMAGESLSQDFGSLHAQIHTVVFDRRDR
jgi:hypothetical protein